MKNHRLLAATICLVIALTQGHIQESYLLAQSEEDFILLGEGSLTLETAILEMGSHILLETDLQDVVRILVEDVDAGINLLSISTTRNELATEYNKPKSTLSVDAPSVKGRLEQNVAYDLRGTRALRVTLTLANGIEVPLIMESEESIAGKRLTRSFNGKACQTYTSRCFNEGTSCSKYCCTAAVCFECNPCKVVCGPCPTPKPTGCGLALPPPQQTIAASLEGLDTVALPKSSFVLHRMEPGNNVSFLMEEWAIIEHSFKPNEVKPRIEILKASSPAFASAKSKDLAQTAHGAQKRRSIGRRGFRETVLIVEAPVHPHNSRFAPAPALRFSESEVPPSIAPVQVLVRADFSEEDHALTGFQILHADGPIQEELPGFLRDRMELERESIRRHRTVVFALIELKDTIKLTTLATVLPKCCCGGVWCI